MSAAGGPIVVQFKHSAVASINLNNVQTVNYLDKDQNVMVGYQPGAGVSMIQVHMGYGWSVNLFGEDIEWFEKVWNFFTVTEEDVS